MSRSPRSGRRSPSSTAASATGSRRRPRPWRPFTPASRSATIPGRPARARLLSKDEAREALPADLRAGTRPAKRHALALGRALGRPRRRSRALARRREPEVLRPHRDRRAGRGLRHVPGQEQVGAGDVAERARARGRDRDLHGSHARALALPLRRRPDREGVAVELRPGDAALPHGEGRPQAPAEARRRHLAAARRRRRGAAAALVRRRRLGRARGDGRLLLRGTRVATGRATTRGRRRMPRSCGSRLPISRRRTSARSPSSASRQPAAWRSSPRAQSHAPRRSSGRQLPP